MGKPKLYGMNNAYIPSSKADMRYRKKVYQRGRDISRQKAKQDALQARKENADGSL